MHKGWQRRSFLDAVRRMAPDPISVRIWKPGHEPPQSARMRTPDGDAWIASQELPRLVRDGIEVNTRTPTGEEWLTLMAGSFPQWCRGG